MSNPVHVLPIFGTLNPDDVETFVMNLYRCIDLEKVHYDTRFLYILPERIATIIDLMFISKLLNWSIHYGA